MTDYYFKQIEELLDQAASDNGLSTEDYIELCGKVEDSAQGRRQASESDLEQ